MNWVISVFQEGGWQAYTLAFAIGVPFYLGLALFIEKCIHGTDWAEAFRWFR